MKPTIKSFVLLFIVVFTTGTTKSQQPKDFVINVITTISENPVSISFSWDMIPGDSVITIHRKSKGDREWGNALAILPADATVYTDNSVEIGVEYEYRILKESPVLYQYLVIENYTNMEDVLGYANHSENWPSDNKQIVTYINAGINLPEVEYRGKVILLVDSSFVDSLKNELHLFETDLLGDGWKVLRKDVSRNASVKYVKSVVRDFYYSDTINVKSLILFGHIPVSYSGARNADLHYEGVGASCSDIYYGSMNEEIWTDEAVNIDTLFDRRHDENNNIPGDGKFDLSVLPPNENIVLQIGRIDMSRMPAFPVSESALLRNYIYKDHDFRHKRNDPKVQGLIYDNFGWNVWAPGLSARRNFTALVTGPKIKDGDYFDNGRAESFMFSYACGGGDGPYLGNSITPVGTTNDFVRYNVKTVFNSFASSVTVHWNYPDNFLRASLASNGWQLTCCWEGWPYYTFHPMGMGETIGYGIQITQNNIDTYDFNTDNRGMHENLLGDPTLRMHIVCPVNSLQSAVTEDSIVMLAWKPADDSIIGYHVYKLDTLLNEYNRITTEPVTDTWYEDTLPAPGNNYYMVKSYQLTESASGSYYNLSQGVFDTLNYKDKPPVPIDSIELYLASSNLLPLMIFNPIKVNAFIWPDSATNKLLKWSVENITANGKLDVEGNILSDKGGTLIVKAEALDGSGTVASLEITIDSIPYPAETITGDTAACRNNATLLYTVPEIRGVDSYIWTFPNGVTKTTTLNECTYTMDDKAVSGLIRVKGHNPYVDGEESTLHLTIYEKPEKPEIEWIDNILQSNAPEGNQWYKDGIAIEGATEQTYTPTDSASYFVKVILNGCTSNNSNRESYPPVGLETELFSVQVQIYPNPAIGELTIEFEKEQTTGTTIELLDISGKVVYTGMINPGETQHQINLTSFEEGLYLIRISNTDYTVTKKVIKVE